MYGKSEEPDRDLAKDSHRWHIGVGLLPKLPILTRHKVRDEATFDPTLKEPIEYSVSNPSKSPASSIYGPSFIKLAGSYPGSVVLGKIQRNKPSVHSISWYLGLNRGGDNLTNTIEAAKVANAEMRNLHALELGNEPVS